MSECSRNNTTYKMTGFSDKQWESKENSTVLVLLNKDDGGFFCNLIMFAI